MKKSESPEWEERFEFILAEPPRGDQLHLEVKSKDSDMLGKLTHHKVRTTRKGGQPRFFLYRELLLLSTEAGQRWPAGYRLSGVEPILPLIQ